MRASLRAPTWSIDGRAVVPDGEADGFWLGPTLFDRVRPGMSIYDEEIFGPVLSVVRAATYDDALALVNANPYGNGTAIFTADGGAARRFQREVEVGMVGINVPIPVPMAYYSFGGLEVLAVRRHPRPRRRGHPLLHPRQGRHLALARPVDPARDRPRLPAARLSSDVRGTSTSRGLSQVEQRRD